jgi:hypothetical protein
MAMCVLEFWTHDGPWTRPRHGPHGWAVQVAPIKPNLKPPGIKRLKVHHDEVLSNFGFKFNLRRYTMGGRGGHMGGYPMGGPGGYMPMGGRGGGPPRQGLTLVPISAQLELFRPPYNPT